jgi:hypothetical protein
MRRVNSAVTAVCLTAGVLTAPLLVQSATAAPPVPSVAPAVHRPAPARPTTLSAATSVSPLPQSVPTAGRAQAKSSATVTVTGDAATVRASVAHLGGRVLVSAQGQSTVELPASAVGALGRAPGVSAVDAPTRAFETASDEGVAKSGANVWQSAGDNGAGTIVAIVDAGYGGLAAEQAAHNLPPTGGSLAYINEGCASGGATDNDSQHGTAVAEIVHQMAPAATLYLYCVQDSVGFNAAATSIIESPHHPKIATSSLGFPADSRGDGSGATNSAAAAVRRARLAGVLWIQSAGNNAQEHWSGKLSDSDHDHFVDLGCSGSSCPEADAFYTDPNSSGAEAVLKWDAWPTTNTTDIKLIVREYFCTSEWNSCDTQPDGQAVGTHRAGTEPTIVVDVPSTGQFVLWNVSVQIGVARPTVGLDLSYWGDVDDPSYLAFNHPAQAAADSISEPASSPYALAVGAACATTANVPCTVNGIEPFSSRGPTIDGRIKPDLTGWDCVSSNLAEFSDGFCGTSAAAPHVAGAAALLEASNPNLDAAQLESLLQARANHTKPYAPATNTAGAGLLTLDGYVNGIAPPPGSGYVPLAPTGVLDTRTTLGGHHSKLGGGRTVTVHVPNLPPDVTAVAVDLTGVNATTATGLSVYQGGDRWPGTTNVAINATDKTVTSFAVATVNPSADTITVFNSHGFVDAIASVVGYFRTATTAPGYFASPLRTVLATWTTVGNHHYKLGNGGAVIVNPQIPAGATAAVINLTAVNVAGPGFLSAGPSCSLNSHALTVDTHTRTGLAIVKVSSGRQICLMHYGSPIDVKVQVLGYFAPGGARFHSLPSPSRIVNTSTGNQERTPVPIGARKTALYVGAGINGVPYAAKSLLTELSNFDSTGTSGFLSTFPGKTLPKYVPETLDYTRGRNVNDAAIIGLSGSRYGIYNSTGTSHAVLDLYGYFL